MKKKLFSILALVLVAMTASATAGYDLKVGTSEHGTITFKVGTNDNATYADEGDVVTVTITPATGWVVNQPSGQWYAAVAASRGQRRVPAQGSSIGLLSEVEFTPVEGKENTWTFEMKRANAEISATYKKLLTNTDISIEDIDALTYTGQELKPVVSVKDGTTALVLGTDYTVEYAENVNVGMATVTIKAVATSEKYAGETTKTFTIEAKALEDAMIADIADMNYTGEALTPAPVLTYNKMTLVEGEDKDYTVEYKDNVNVGTATVTVTGHGNYSGTAKKTFVIKKAALTITAEDKTVTYGDEAPEYTVTYSGFLNDETEAVLGGTLAFDCEYVQNESGVGEYTITPKGLTADNYEVTFAAGTLTVGQKALDDAMIADIEALTYNSEAQTPAPVVTFNGMTLVEGDDKDYTVAYSDNTDAGTATVTITGHGNYSGTATKTFVIEAAELTEAALVETSFVYNKQQQTAVVESVKAGELDVPAEGYDVSGNTATNVGTYTATVTGKGNYKGTQEMTFTITEADAEQKFDMALTVDELVYDGSGQEPAVIVKDGDDVLEKDKDYTLSYEDNINTGTGKVIVTGIGNYSGTLEMTFTIVKGEYTVTAPTAISPLAYNAKEQALVTAGTVNAGQILYSLDGETYGTDVPTAMNAGKYTVYYKVEASDNYNGCGGSLPVSIAQGQGRIEMLDDEVTIPYNAGSLTVKPMVILGDGPLRYASSNDSVAKAIFYSGELFINSVGQTTVTVIMTSTSNVTADTTSFVLTVEPASAALVNITRQTMGYGVPTFKVSSSVETLTEGKDYTLSYRDLQGHAVTEEEMLAAPGNYVVVATLKGNYKGTQELEFSVTADPMTGIGAVTADGDGTVRYDMSGRRVTKTHRGLVIENGKRYVKK